MSTGELITIRNYIEEVVIPDLREGLFYRKHKGEEKVRVKINVEKFKNTLKVFDVEIMSRFQYLEE